MLRDWAKELSNRIKFVKQMLAQSGAKGIVYGNSGGKDCSLVSIICRLACENTLGIVMPCHSKQNYGSDMQDAAAVAKQFKIQNITVDLTATRKEILKEIDKSVVVNESALSNVAPRLRMTTLYAVAQSLGYLVAGTGNASEYYMGYFTKWGDGACDFNCIVDLTANEVFDFLRYLGAPSSVIDKAPSAGLYDGQTDEKEMGVSYSQIDAVIYGEKVDDDAKAIIERHHNASMHKRATPTFYTDEKTELP